MRAPASRVSAGWFLGVKSRSDLECLSKDELIELLLEKQRGKRVLLHIAC